MKPEYRRLFLETKTEGSLSERIASVVDLHGKSWEQNKAVLRSTKAQLWRYQALRDNYARVNRYLRKDLVERIPELNEVDADTREIVVGLVSFEMWARLREHQKLSRAKSSRIIRQSVELILQTELDAS
jgi:hypothetical protein